MGNISSTLSIFGIVRANKYHNKKLSTEISFHNRNPHFRKSHILQNPYIFISISNLITIYIRPMLDLSQLINFKYFLFLDQFNHNLNTRLSIYFYFRVIYCRLLRSFLWLPHILLLSFFTWDPESRLDHTIIKPTPQNRS